MTNALPVITSVLVLTWISFDLLLINERHRVFISREIEKKFNDVSNRKGAYVKDKGPERLDKLEKKVFGDED